MKRNRLIEKFIDLSGRADFNKNDVIEYLNSGLRYLDEHIEFSNLYATYVKKVSAGDFLHIFNSDICVLKQVTLLPDIKLSQLSLNELNALNPSLIGSKDAAEPSFYALAKLRRVPNTDLAESDTSPYNGKLGFIETGDSETVNGIIFDCPLDKEYVLKAEGKFYTPPFAEIDDDNEVGNVENWWSKNYPDLVLYAALFKLELTYRNTEGAKDWLNALEIVAREPYHTFVEQETFNIDHMEG